MAITRNNLLLLSGGTLVWFLTMGDLETLNELWVSGEWLEWLMYPTPAWVALALIVLALVRK